VENKHECESCEGYKSKYKDSAEENWRIKKSLKELEEKLENKEAQLKSLKTNLEKQQTADLSKKDRELSTVQGELDKAIQKNKDMDAYIRRLEGDLNLYVSSYKNLLSNISGAIDNGKALEDILLDKIRGGN